MKQKKVLSQYKNPDRLIKTLRKQLDRQEDVNVELVEQSVRFETLVKERAGEILTYWENSIETQTMLGKCPNELHVGEHISQTGRVVEVLEKLNEKGQPVTIYKYELKQTRIIPNIETSSETEL